MKHSGQGRSAQIGTAEIRALQVYADEARIAQMGVGELCGPKVGIGQVSTAEVHTSQVAPFAPNSDQFPSPPPFWIEKGCSVNKGAREVSVSEIHTR
jgi:hypothetical protein